MSHDPAADATGAERPADVTALVLLRSPGGDSVVGGEPISRRQLDRVVPVDDDVAEVAEGLRSLGFDVGPMLGISMSITAPRARFEAVFGVTLEPEYGTWKVSGRVDRRQSDDVAPPGDVVPHDALEASIAQRIDRIIFEPPRELHEESSWTF